MKQYKKKTSKHSYNICFVISVWFVTNQLLKHVSKKLKTNKRRLPNKGIGMGKIFKINKRSAYTYSELNSTWLLENKLEIPK